MITVCNNIKQKTAIFLIVAVFAIALDRFLKALAVGGYFDRPINIFGDIISFIFQANYNIAFSIPINGIYLNIIIILIILSLIAHLVFLFKKNNFNLCGPIVFMIVGAASNLFDRLEYGYVIDYIYLRHFTVFNLADTLILFGVVFMFFDCNQERT